MGSRRLGEPLRKQHGLSNCKRGYYSTSGAFFECPVDFPAVLFDQHGYYIAESFEAIESNPDISVGKKLNVPKGINSLRGYIYCCEESHESM